MATVLQLEQQHWRKRKLHAALLRNDSLHVIRMLMADIPFDDPNQQLQEERRLHDEYNEPITERYPTC
jgi:hypothetical protein